MTDCRRRLFLQGVGVTSLLGLGLSLGLVRPARALSIPWPGGAFRHKDVPGALSALFGSVPAVPSRAVHLGVAELAENGAVVPITIRTTLPRVQAVAVLVDHNPFPLATVLHTTPGAAGFLKTRIKMNKTSPVRAYVRTPTGLYFAVHTVKVTVGGCGG